MPVPTDEQLNRFITDPVVYADKGYFFKAMREMDSRFAEADPAKQEQIYTSLKSKFGGAAPAPEAPVQKTPPPAGGNAVGDFLWDMFLGAKSGLRSTADFVGDLGGMVGLSPVKQAAHTIGETIISDTAREEASKRSPWGYGIGYGAEQLGEALLGGGVVKKGGQLALEQLGKSAIKAGVEAGAEAAAKATAEELAKAGAQRFAGKVVEKATQTVPGQMGIYSFVRGDEDGPFSPKAGLRGAVEGYLFHKAGGIKSTPLAAAASGAVGATGGAFEASAAQSALDRARAAYSADPSEQNKQAVAQALEQAEEAKNAILSGFVMGAGMTAAPRMIKAVRPLTSMRVPGEGGVSGETPGALAGEAPRGVLEAEATGRKNPLSPVKDAKGRSEAASSGTPPPADGGAGIGAAPAQGGINQDALRIVKSKLAPGTEWPDAQIINTAKAMAADAASMAKITDPQYRDAILALAGAQPAAPAGAAKPAAKTALTRDKLKDPQWMEMLESRPNPTEDITRAIDAISNRKSGNKEITPATIANALIGQKGWFPDSNNTGQLSKAELSKARSGAQKGLRDAVEVYMNEKGIEFKPSSSPAAKPIEPTPLTPGEAPAEAATSEAPAPAAGAAAPAAGEKPTLAEYRPGTAGKIFLNAPRPKLDQIIQEAAADPKVKNTNQLTSRVINGLGLKYSNEAHGEFKSHVADYLQKNPELAPNIKVVVPKNGSAAVPETPETPASGMGAAAPTNSAPVPPAGGASMAEANAALEWLSQRFKAKDADELSDTIERLRRMDIALPADIKARLDVLDRLKSGVTSQPTAATGNGAAGFGTPRALAAEEEAAYNAVKEYSGAANHDALLNWAAVNYGNPTIPAEVQNAMRAVSKAFPVEINGPNGPITGTGPSPDIGKPPAPPQGMVSELITKLNAINDKAATTKEPGKRGDGNWASIDNTTKFTRQDLADSKLYPQAERLSDEQIEKLGLFRVNADGTFSISDAVANAWTAPDATRTAVTGEPAPKPKRGSRRKPKVPVTPDAPANAPAQEPVQPEVSAETGGITPTPLQAGMGMKPIPASEDPTYAIKPEPKTGAPDATPHTLQDQLAAKANEPITPDEAAIKPQNGMEAPLTAKERKAVASAIQEFKDAAAGSKLSAGTKTMNDMVDLANSFVAEGVRDQERMLLGDKPVIPVPYVNAAKRFLDVYDQYISTGKYAEGSKKK